MDDLKIPVLAFETITPDAFRAKARQLAPAADPLFGLWDIVGVENFAGQLFPAVVIGVSPRNGGWMYDLVSPDGWSGMKRQTVPEKAIKPWEGAS